MKNKVTVVILIMVVMLMNIGSASALQKAELDPYHPSVAYGVQTLNGNLIALNLETDIGLSSNFGVEGLFTHYKDKNKNNRNVLDLNAKLAIINKPDFNLSAIVGYHTKLQELNEGDPRVGLLISKKETDSLDLNVGFDFLLGTGPDENYLGYNLGFDYQLTRRTYLEIEHRRFSGQKRTEGLNVGMRYYF
ncbi:hypothetical protein Halha_2293 [Halobacteroides halobius DSM 5150]|uniref:Outer membrane protein beta-barrel domain-containing protein n=1 Tax=Halobacteroides halobius (strain ATCC 35273 / DSM 5150 / MD-1) TaxID=748449 RepID=L0KA27_HALHC|nr:hypothetical protein [Halobacteroides halobius]AGB42167.1 hypothetical protein Halha_2293 [Halobacteroides halobius DSM 5150]